MSEADKLKELFDIAWDIQIHNKDKNEELVKKLLRYMPDIMQQFDYLENKEITPSKTLEKLGYEKREDNPSILRYWNQDEHEFCDYKISFYKNTKKVEKTRGNFDAVPLTMEELKAIYKYCEDLGWI